MNDRSLPCNLCLALPSGEVAFVPAGVRSAHHGDPTRFPTWRLWLSLGVLSSEWLDEVGPGGARVRIGFPTEAAAARWGLPLALGEGFLSLREVRHQPGKDALV